MHDAHRLNPKAAIFHPFAFREKHVVTPSDSSSAVFTVFGVVELLENILIRLRPRIIISCRQVNKRFRDTIDGSHPIKKVAFLAPNQAPMRFETGMAINPIFASRGLWHRIPKKLSTSKYSFDFISLYRAEPLIDRDRPELGSKLAVKLIIANLRWKSEGDGHIQVNENVVLRQPAGEVIVVCVNHRERAVTAATLEDAISGFTFWDMITDMRKQNSSSSV